MLGLVREDQARSAERFSNLTMALKDSHAKVEALQAEVEEGVSEAYRFTRSLWMVAEVARAERRSRTAMPRSRRCKPRSRRGWVAAQELSVRVQHSR